MILFLGQEVLTVEKLEEDISENKIQKLSKELIEAEIVHLIASEVHNTAIRSFYIKEAYYKLEKILT